MPVWNAYLADLNGDGLPEICATVSIGSGIIDTHAEIFDYANDRRYTLSDRMIHDYALSIKNGKLIVAKSKFNGGELGDGELTVVNNELIANF